MSPKTIALCFIATFLAGMCFDHWVFRQTVQAPETAAPAVHQAPTITTPHGSVVVAREPDRKVKPAQPVPKGSKAQRVAQVTVKPKDCDPVTLDLTTIKDKTGHRLIASSPDGEITGGFDVPLEPMVALAVRPWAAGASYGSDKTYGIFLDRDFGRIRVGGEVDQLKSGGVGARIKVGLTF